MFRHIKQERGAVMATELIPVRTGKVALFGAAPDGLPVVPVLVSVG